ARRVVAALGVDGGGTAAQVLERWPAAAAALPLAARGAADELVAALPAVHGEPALAHAERLLAALTPMIERGYDDASARLADLDALVAAAEGVARVGDVAADVTLEPPQSTGDLAGPPLIDDDYLIISTVHSAKGLEWPVVHLLHAADGNFPSDMALSDREGLEEERRLFYVAVTRPAAALHVYHPLRYHLRPNGRDDAHTYGQPSRFLSDGVRARMDQVTRSGAAPVQMLEPATVTVELELDALWR
ncbi:MAG: 3'-5' exonuclease, partial [Microthrixaceae bacterium]